MTTTNPIKDLEYIKNYNKLNINVHKNMTVERLQNTLQEINEKIKDNAK